MLDLSYVRDNLPAVAESMRRRGQDPDTVLRDFADINAKRSKAITEVETLKAQQVPYRIEGNGATIEVPAAKVHELRLSLAGSGLPRGGGVGFELFDKQTFGTTSFVEQMNPSLWKSLK